MFGNKAFSLSLLALGFVVTATVSRGADDFPSKSVRIIVAYAAGGGNDLIARVLSKRLTETLGKTVFVDNRPGATGIMKKYRTLIGALHGLGYDVPHFCYHPGLSPDGNCRMCYVMSSRASFTSG